MYVIIRLYICQFDYLLPSAILSWRFLKIWLNFLLHSSIYGIFTFLRKNGAQIRAGAFTFLRAAPVPIFLYWFIRSSRTFEDQLPRPIGSRYRKLHIPLFKCAIDLWWNAASKIISTLATRTPYNLPTRFPYSFFKERAGENKRNGESTQNHRAVEKRGIKIFSMFSLITFYRLIRSELSFLLLLFYLLIFFFNEDFVLFFSRFTDCRSSRTFLCRKWNYVLYLYINNVAFWKIL